MAWSDEPQIAFSDEFEPLVELNLPREPVSAGADGRKRRGLKEDIQALTRGVPWMYTGDVSIEIEWTVHLRWRYESDRAVDVDNIVKPILDGLTGPDGILIDDTQVNHVSVHWTTWTRTDRQHVRISIRSLDQDLYEQRGFALIEIRPRLCLPAPAVPDDEVARNILMDAWSMQFDTQDHLMESGVAWETARAVLPIQRVFHRNKLAGFTIITPEQYRSGAWTEA